MRVVDTYENVPGSWFEVLTEARGFDDNFWKDACCAVFKLNVEGLKLQSRDSNPISDYISTRQISIAILMSVCGGMTSA